MHRLSVVAGLFSLLAWGTATGGELALRRFPLPDHGVFVIPLPDAWQDEVSQPPAGLPPTLRFTAKSGVAFEILITPLWSMNGKLPDAATLRKEVGKSAQAAQPRALEHALKIMSMKGRSGVGYYFSATDRAPPPGEYRHLTQGILAVGELTVTFTVLTNDGSEPTVKAALDLLQDAVHDKTSAGP